MIFDIPAWVSAAVVTAVTWVAMVTEKRGKK